jgi:A/G-specific adenine glycosylase
VTAVVPYFERFVRAFPTVESLARADEQSVLKLWEGLGYYRRARHLHAAARRLVADHGGLLPDDQAVWAALPGVGRYILGAVLSQAFERKYPIVEANTLRVLARLFGYRKDPRVGEGKRWVWSAAETVLPNRRIGDFNQAMMELGALVCTPVTPKCDACPLASACEAMRSGIQLQIPPKLKRRDQVTLSEIAVAIRNARGKVLVGRRRVNVRWPGMWELPHAPWKPEESMAVAVVRIARGFTRLPTKAGPALAEVNYSVNHFRYALTAVMARAGKGQPRSGFYDELRWVTPSELATLPASTPQRKLFAELARPGRQLRLW